MIIPNGNHISSTTSISPKSKQPLQFHNYIQENKLTSGAIRSDCVVEIANSCENNLVSNTTKETAMKSIYNSVQILHKKPVRQLLTIVVNNLDQTYIMWNEFRTNRIRQTFHSELIDDIIELLNPITENYLPNELNLFCK